MRIDAIELAGFTNHAKTRVALPERGIVVVRGDNGSGKSSLVEAVSVALFGKTLRGADPWSGAGYVSVASDDLTIERKRTKSGHVRLKFGSTTWREKKTAQADLESTIGSFDVWRRSCVFSSADAAHFTLATDAKRKAFLEAVLGLGRFDAALKACRADLAAARKERDRLLREHAVLTERADGLAKRVADAAAHTADDAPSADDLRQQQAEIKATLRQLAARKPQLDDEVANVDKAIVDKQAEIAALDSQLREAEAEARRAQALVREAGEECATCGHALDEHAAAHLVDLVDIAQARVREGKRKHASLTDTLYSALRTLQAKQRNLTGQVHELRDERTVLHSKSCDLDVYIERAERADELAEVARKKLADLRQQHLDALDDLCDADAGLADADELVCVLEAVEQVLGLRGVRAQVLDDALGGVQEVANAWLARLAGDLSLELHSCSELKTGGVVDAISMQVHGAGGGHGYKASSGGERRRIDVALMLALGEVSRAAVGAKQGTLFIDEAMDTLDKAGTDAAIDALCDLSQDCCVVVITHSRDLAARLPAVARLTVDKGVVKQ